MQVIFDRSFSKALGKIKDNKILERIEATILNCEEASNLNYIKNLKKLSGFRTFYRIKVGEYRLGFELEKPATIRFITVLHRKDIYNRFP